MPNGSIVIPDRPRDPGDLLRNIMEMLVPIMLTAVIVALILFSAHVEHQFRQTAKTVQTTACNAVKASNDANYNLWSSQIEANRDPKQTAKEKAQVVAFLKAMREGNHAINDRCLAGQGTPSTR